MPDIIIITSVALIIFCACFYIRREKRAGRVCIGCPSAGTCSGHCSGDCGRNCSGDCSGNCHKHSD